MKRLLVILGVLSFNLHFSTFNLLSAKTKEVHLKWIHTSDVHGSLFGYDYLTKRSSRGGLASIYAYTQDQRHLYGDRLILTDGGDCLQGQPTAYYYNFIDTVSPHLVAEAMNLMGYDCGAMGNHDIEVFHLIENQNGCISPVSLL